MSLNTVTLTFAEQDAADGAGTGSVTIAPTSVVVAAGQTVVSQQPVVRALGSGAVSVELAACDNPGTIPAAGFWAYSITLPGGTPQLYLINFAGGATQRFDSLTPVVAQTTYGPATAGAVASVNGHTGAVVLAAADVGALAAAGGTMTGALVPAVVALTDAATIAVNAALGNDFRVTLAGNRTMGAPTSPTDGQDITFLLTQDATGSRTVTWNAVYDFGTSGAPTLTTTAATSDLVAFKYAAAAAKWLCLGSGLGF